jgi:hypothetical protein
MRTGILAAVCVAWAASAGTTLAQESPAAKATRKKLKQKITLEFKKEIPIKEVVEEIKREFDGRLGIKIDNVSGISNNSKVSIVAKDQPLEKILNELSDKYDMGWIVVSNPKERYDGWIILRKSKYKERGYEGKEKGARAPGAPPTLALTTPGAAESALLPRARLLALPADRLRGLC